MILLHFRTRLECLRTHFAMISAPGWVVCRREDPYSSPPRRFPATQFVIFSELLVAGPPRDAGTLSTPTRSSGLFNMTGCMHPAPITQTLRRGREKW